MGISEVIPWKTYAELFLVSVNINWLPSVDRSCALLGSKTWAMVNGTQGCTWDSQRVN